MKQYLLLLLGIIASSSMASSFGTSARSPLFHTTNPSKPFLPQGVTFNIRGGSDNNDALPAQSSDDEFDSETSDDEFVETPPQTVVSPSPTTTNGMGANATPPGPLRKLFPRFPWKTLPDLLTYARCLAIPALVVQFYCSTHPHKSIHSSLIFAIASITDFLDGYLARRWDICSPFGAFLDPVADKLMVSTALILLAGEYGPFVAIPSAIILAREIAVSALREWMASKGKRDSVKVGIQGKFKAAATMIAISVILAVPEGTTLLPIWDVTMKVGMSLLYFSAIITVTSGWVYFKAAAPALMGKE